MASKTPPPGAGDPPRPPHEPPGPPGENPAPGSGLHTFEPDSRMEGDFSAPAPVFRIPALTRLQERFCEEYATDLNATQAYLRANPKVTLETAQTEGWKVLQLPGARARVQELLDERAQRTAITADRLLIHLWNVATADPRELTEMRVGCCRHCWGLYNQYQYTDGELEMARDKHTREQADKVKKAEAAGRKHEPAPFHEKGGGGYQRDRPPNPECGECAGEGHSRPVFHDTRHLGEKARALFAGIKLTKHGIEYKTHDQLEAARMVGAYLGMWDKNKPLGDGPTDPLRELYEELVARGQTMALGVVQQDPEAGNTRLGGEVEEAVVKPAAAPKAKRTYWKPVTKD